MRGAAAATLSGCVRRWCRLTCRACGVWLAGGVFAVWLVGCVEQLSSAGGNRRVDGVCYQHVWRHRSVCIHVADCSVDVCPYVCRYELVTSSRDQGWNHFGTSGQQFGKTIATHGHVAIIGAPHRDGGDAWGALM